MAPSSSRGNAPFLWIVIHTAEGARTKESLGAYFNSGVAASSHVGIDADGILQYVLYGRAAWTLRNGNEESDNAEICGFARWTRAQWLSTDTVDGCANPRQMVRNAARWAAARCRARGVPMRRLTTVQVGARSAQGVIDHHDYTLGTGDGTHTDVGENFPWDVFFADMRSGAGEDDDMPTPAEVWGYDTGDDDAWQILRDIREFVKANPNWSTQAGWLHTALSDMQEDNDQIKTALATLIKKVDALTPPPD